MTVAFDTSWTAVQTLGSSTPQDNFHTPGASATLMIVGVSSSQAIQSVTDNNSNAYTLIQLGLTPAGQFLALAYALNPVISSTQHTAHLAASGSSEIGGATFLGTASSSPQDRQANTNGTSTAPDSGATSATRFANEVLIGIACHEGSATTWTSGAGYTDITNLSSGSSPGIKLEYQIVSATGTYNGTATLGASRGWAAGIVTFADTPIIGIVAQGMTAQTSPGVSSPC